MPCYCGSGLNYQECCEEFHKGGAAPTAEKLMRSRYSAYVLKDEKYLLETWHPSKRPKNLNLQDDQTEWLALEIVKTQKGLENDSEGSVEFIASFKSGGQECKMRELSKFVKRNGRWIYRDGKAV